MQAPLLAPMQAPVQQGPVQAQQFQQQQPVVAVQEQVAEVVQPLQLGQQGQRTGVSVDQLSAALATAMPKKKRCYRCGVAGHRSADCKVNICDLCEGPAHGDKLCHLLTAPKPQVRVHGYGHEELIFFEYPCTASYRPRMENVRLASLVVIGGDDDSKHCNTATEVGSIRAVHLGGAADGTQCLQGAISN